MILIWRDCYGATGGYVRRFPYVKGSTKGDSFCNNIFLMRFTNNFDLICVFERVRVCVCVWQWKGNSGSRWKEDILWRLYIFVRIKSVCLRAHREWKCRNHYNHNKVKIDFRIWHFKKLIFAHSRKSFLKYFSIIHKFIILVSKTSQEKIFQIISLIL